MMDPRPKDGAELLDRLRRLSSAEEIFAELGLGYRPEVLNVARLHVMKRFGEKLAALDLGPLDAAAARTALRAALSQAHDDFAERSPREVGVFRVFARPSRQFLPLSGLRITTD